MLFMVSGRISSGLRTAAPLHSNVLSDSLSFRWRPLCKLETWTHSTSFSHAQAALHVPLPTLPSTAYKRVPATKSMPASFACKPSRHSVCAQSWISLHPSGGTLAKSYHRGRPLRVWELRRCGLASKQCSTLQARSHIFAHSRMSFMTSSGVRRMGRP